ncbi:hypothetical protein TAMA11512_01980 [Selenomonas sp. TAMA-11512]|uniref:HepT-like ribonuclease domain-containing protein n=1 Tax=Selenomonas sp. TAMA-11512 TaxID=3095337 RepID=UPI0030934DA3|nr:hypothetical protein TAMA11512_01980 [Selenomonas sp. TAMA-11512]
MTLGDKDTAILQHMVEHALQVELTLQRFGRDRAAFNRDFLFRNALSMPIFAITELAKHLSKEFRDTYDEIPWQLIGSMRNRFAHEYNAIDWDICWNTAIEDIPMLSQFAVNILQRNNQPVPTLTDVETDITIYGKGD